MNGVVDKSIECQCIRQFFRFAEVCTDEMTIWELYICIPTGLAVRADAEIDFCLDRLLRLQAAPDSVQLAVFHEYGTRAMDSN